MSHDIHDKAHWSWTLLVALARFFSPMRAGLLLFVVVPTALAIGYYGFIASDIYVSESAFSVRSDKASAQPTDSGTLLPALLASATTSSDQLVVNSFIISRGAVEALQGVLDMPAIYRNSLADKYARLSDDATREEIVEYYQDMVTLLYEEHSMITTLKARAFSAEEAQKLNNALLEQAESFVNRLSEQMRNDSMAFAAKQAKAAEKDLMAASKALTAFREANSNFDPTLSSQGAVALVQTLRNQLTERLVKRDALQGVMTAKNPQIIALNREIESIEQQVKQEEAKLVSAQPNALSKQLEDYSSLVLNHEFATKRYGLSLAALEVAQADAGRKQIYLTRVVSPSLPQEAAEPRRIYRVFSVFFLSALAYSMLLLVALSIADHIRR